VPATAESLASRDETEKRSASNLAKQTLGLTSCSGIVLYHSARWKKRPLGYSQAMARRRFTPAACVCARTSRHVAGSDESIPIADFLSANYWWRRKRRHAFIIKMSFSGNNLS
jgi:hypothetical protein